MASTRLATRGNMQDPAGRTLKRPGTTVRHLATRAPAPLRERLDVFADHLAARIDRNPSEAII
jgi:hypothetical protein